MNNVAYKERDYKDIKQREKTYIKITKILNKYRQKYSLDIKKNPIKSFLVLPLIENKEDLHNLKNRLKFSLPNKNKPYIHILTSSDLKKENLDCEQIILIDKNQLEKHLENDFILLHNVKEILKPSIFRYAYKIDLIDNNFYSDKEAETLRGLFFNTLTIKEKESFLQLSKKNFNNLLDKHKSKDKAYCFTSGPSFDTYKDLDIDNSGLKIICNSIVKNNDFLEHIEGPDIITFADPVFHFGSSSYAEVFRQDAISVAKKYNSYIIIPFFTLPLFLSHYPSLKDNVIGLPSSLYINFPNEHSFFIKNSANILTLFMIPLASSLANEIFLIGADGRESNEKYFWKHSSTVQYDDKMESAFLTHPSFFRDRSYTDYYDTHCIYLKKLIEYGEFQGKKYISLTKSYIPALKSRLKETPIDKSNIENLNLNFSKKMNTLYSYINYLKCSEFKIAIFGFGLIGKLLIKELKKQVVVIIDNKISQNEYNIPMCKSEDLANYNFDKLVISVLGRESMILKNLSIKKTKLFLIDIKKSINLPLILDKQSKEFKEENIYGPFERKSKVSIDETKIVFELLKNKPAGTMIDVGAHHGTALKNFLNKQWQVYAYEPDPNNRALLEKNFKNNENLKISDNAISNKGNQTLSFYSSYESTGISGLSAFTNNHKKLCEVKVTTLKEQIKSNTIEQVNFLKIDTEGFDLMVLEGFPWEKISPDVIECEFEDLKTKPLGYLVKDLINFLIEKNYTVYISEWYPIIQYGIRHDWKRFFKYNDRELNSDSWGNILAFKNKISDKKIKKAIKKLLKD